MQSELILPRGYDRRRRLRASPRGLGLGGLGLSAGGSTGAGLPSPVPPLTGWVQDMNAATAASVTLGAGSVLPNQSPAVSVTGTPNGPQTTSANAYVEIDITTGGTLGTSQFTWKLNGVVQATGVPTSGSVPLTGSGYTAQFAAGTYVLNAVYNVGSGVAGWTDRTGTGNWTQATVANRLSYCASDASMNGKPSLLLTAPLSISGTITVAQPNTVFVVGWMGLTSGGDIFDGITTRQSIGMNTSGFYAYAGGSVVNFGPARDTAMHAWAVVFNGASSVGYVDSSATPYALAAIGTNSLVGPSVAGAFPDGSGAGAARVLVNSGSLTATQIGQVFAYLGTTVGKSWS